MIFKPATWYRIAFVLSVLNLVGAGFAIGQAEPLQLSVDHLPPGVTAQFANATIQSDSGTTLTVKTDQTVTGTVPIVVRASGSKATHDTSAALVIQPSAPPPNPSTQPNSPGGSGCSTSSGSPSLIPVALATLYLARRRRSQQSGSCASLKPIRELE